MLSRSVVLAGWSCASMLSAACSSSPGELPDAPVAPTCAAITGAGTMHVNVTGDEVWTAEASPHVITSSLSIAAGQTLTIAPCATVRLDGLVGILVEGTLIAEGSLTEPIQIERNTAATAWSSIEARAGAQVRLAHVTLDGGGNPNGGRLTQYGALDIRADQAAAPQPILRVVQVTISGSQSLGIQLREGGGFAPGSSELTISGAASYPMSIWGRAAGSIPTGTYTSNAVDELLIPASFGVQDIQEDTTLFARGVPYLVGGPTGGTNLRVSGASVPVLTIEPGVTLRFSPGVRLELGAATATSPALGALRAEGTVAAPIVFTSAAATPAAGDWVGIVIGGLPDPRNRISNARIAYAGGSSQASSFDCPSPANPGFANEGALLVLGGEPPTAFVTSTTIEHSAGDGIVRGWTGSALDLLATNTFASIARCNQTFPRPSGGSCPDPAPCPR